MHRREFLTLMGAGALAAGVEPKTAPAGLPKADITLTISHVVLELTRSLAITTVGYNGGCPGPVLRMREGVPQIVDVINETDVPEQVHWHGLLLPSELDGADEEGTLPVPPHGRRRYRFTPTPAGTRWYHTHTMAMNDLHRGSYTGQFGFLMIESKGDPGHYDQEVFLALRDWEPFLTDQMIDPDSLAQQWPQTEKPEVIDSRPNGLEVTAALYSINDKAVGAGEPIRVREGQRVLFHLLNASGVENRTISLPGHRFQVFALDGNPVPSPQPVEQILIGPGERVDAYVDMNHPGVWVLGAVENDVRSSGLGVIIEYANQQRQPEWFPPSRTPWDYTIFGNPIGARNQPTGSDDVETIDLVFEKVPRAYGPFNGFLVNGQPYPHAHEFVLRRGRTYRLVLRNRTDDAHPLHLHRHSFELLEIYGKPTSGVIKDTVVVPNYGRAVVQFVADQPGLTLLHCHIQQHMDYGFKALFRYA